MHDASENDFKLSQTPGGLVSNDLTIIYRSPAEPSRPSPFVEEGFEQFVTVRQLISHPSSLPSRLEKKAEIGSPWCREVHDWSVQTTTVNRHLVWGSTAPWPPFKFPFSFTFKFINRLSFDLGSHFQHALPNCGHVLID